MNLIQEAKNTVRSYYKACESFQAEDLRTAAQRFMGDDFHWRGMYPFGEITGAENVINEFWLPLTSSLRHLQRREDIFFAGYNDVGQDATTSDKVWTCSMGHFMGLLDAPFLQTIQPTGRMAFLRYAEFFEVVDGQITQGALFCDLISLMHQAGCYPLPPMTGAHFIYPGPRTHDGLLFADQNPLETDATIALVNRMIDDLGSLNHLEKHRCPPELLARCWSENMIWYGPCGIGASYTIERYQEQHQYPFRLNLTEKTYYGHVARFAEGNYCGFFGWSNLSNRNTGGFLGLPEARKATEMRVVDIYRREGDKLVENWVLMDLPYYLAQQGLDIFERQRELGRSHS